MYSLAKPTLGNSQVFPLPTQDVFQSTLHYIIIICYHHYYYYYIIIIIVIIIYMYMHT